MSEHIEIVTNENPRFWPYAKVSLSMEDPNSIMPATSYDSIVMALHWISIFKTVPFGAGA